MGEVFQYLVESDSVSLMELKNLQEYTIKPLLRTIPGVADVNSWGGMVQQFHVDVDPGKLAGYGLTLHDVERALADNNGNFGAGYIETPRRALHGARPRPRRERRRHRQRRRGDARRARRFYVHDVAQVALGPMPREGAVSRDGRGETLSGMIVMLKGPTAARSSARWRRGCDARAALLPAGVTIRPFYNQGEVVDRTTHTVFKNLLEGGLLVTLILFVFLRNIRASLITASVIPLSLLFAFVAMKQFGVSANLMSLGALDFGLLVDASVVMVENFVRRLEHAGRR